MKKLFLVLLSVIVLASCDDGDLIVTDFNFEDQDLQFCAGTSDRNVLFKINNTLTNEAIALVFTLPAENDNFLIDETGTFVIPVNQNNRLVYRTFDAEVRADYFCSEIPPSTPNVVDEYRSTTKGEIVITSTFLNALDHDQDGVPTLFEQSVEAPFSAAGFPDTDGDGIPNYLDIDDDNDNVITARENEVEAGSTAMGYPDSDGDGIPNFIDPDDDNDGVITRYEDWNQNVNPADDVNDESIPHYLNPEITDSFPLDTYRPNRIQRGYRYSVVLLDITLQRQGGDGEEITFSRYEMGSFNSGTVTEEIPFVDPDPATEEEDE